jgi:hypothetical protein
MKINKLIEIIQKKAVSHWPDAKSVSVSITIEASSHGSKTKYTVHSMPHYNVPYKSRDIETWESIFFNAFSVTECLQVFDQKSLAIKKNEQIELEDI